MSTLLDLNRRIRNAGLPQRDTYTVPETARILGSSTSTTYRAIQDGSLRATRTRKHYRVSRWAIEEKLRDDLLLD